MSAKDKERLDWLMMNKVDLFRDGHEPRRDMWGVQFYHMDRSRYFTYKGSTPRRAIDAAMKGER